MHLQAMMRLLISGIFPVVFLLGQLEGTCNALDSSKVRPKNDRGEAGLLGHVKSVITRSGAFTTTDTYNNFGNLLEKVQVVTDEHRGGFPFTSVYEYDVAGKKIQMWKYAENRSLLSRTIYNYDVNQNLTAELTLSAEGLFQAGIFLVFDAKSGKPISKILLHPGSRLQELFEYDDRGNKVKTLLYEDMVLRSEVRYSYDDKGRLQESALYSSDKKLEQKDVFNYDDKGNRTERQVYLSEGKLSGKEHSDFEYDDRGNWITRTTRYYKDNNGTLVQANRTVERRTIAYY
jgi:antitoxin component YwqK of YwqJK toxin-antitoxin module